jgi:hypothetical protein
VRAFSETPLTGRKFQVSYTGGAWPRWRRDSRELFLFTPGIYSPDATFDATADGKRFVLPAPPDVSKVESPSVFLNWAQSVGHQMPELP